MAPTTGHPGTREAARERSNQNARQTALAPRPATIVPPTEPSPFQTLYWQEVERRAERTKAEQRRVEVILDRVKERQERERKGGRPRKGINISRTR